MAAVQEFPTLDQLIAEAGDDGIDMSRGKGKSDSKYESPFEVNRAYPIEFTAEKHAVSRFGANQQELSISIVKPDGTLRPAGRDWIDLPVLTAEKRAELSPEDAEKAVTDAGKKLHSALRAVSPDGRFNVYARSEKNGRKWKFFNAAGEEMSNVEKKKAELAMGKAVVGVAKLMIGGQQFFTGKRCYVVRTESKTKPGKFFMNYYSEQPTSYELGEVK